MAYEKLASFSWGGGGGVVVEGRVVDVDRDGIGYNEDIGKRRGEGRE